MIIVINVSLNLGWRWRR